MKTLLILSLLVFMTVGAMSQNDPEAVSILDRFSSRALGAPSISMKFNLVTTDQAEGTNTTKPGTIILSKDKYKLDLEDNIIWFNGETSWSYLPAEKEVTITKPDKNDDSFQTHPSTLFSLYKNGYKCRLVNETSDVWIIDLYPEEINSDHTRIRLAITKPSLDLRSAEYKYKNGITVTLNVSSYDLKQKTDAASFTFPAGNYRGVEIVDMR